MWPLGAPRGALDIFGAHHVALANPNPLLFGNDCQFSLQVFAIVHDGSVVIANLQIIATITTLVTLVKVVNPILRNVVPLNCHIIVPISPGVLMEES